MYRVFHLQTHGGIHESLEPDKARDTMARDVWMDDPFPWAKASPQRHPSEHLCRYMELYGPSTRGESPHTEIRGPTPFPTKSLSRIRYSPECG